MVPADQSQYSGLALRIESQKDLQEKGELSEKHKALLDCLGLEWGRKSSPPKRKAVSNPVDCKGPKQVGEKHSPSVTTVETSADPMHPQGTPPLARLKDVSEDAASPKRVKTADVSLPPRTFGKPGGVSEGLEVVSSKISSSWRDARRELRSKTRRERSMQVKHLRRRIRQTRGLEASGEKRDLDELLEKAISFDGKMMKRSKVIALLKHRAA